MKIQRIKFENFRNFKEPGEIDFSTDGKVSIIYGMNGDGKTTLHQLFQWIFYGEVHFNKTSSDILYNLSYENEVPVGDVFTVSGTVDFENNGTNFTLTRIAKYQKAISDSKRIQLLADEEVYMQRRDKENNWEKVDDPQELIEMYLPKGLSEYFFFDGETMIADLSVKGKDSASKLRKAIYSMFELDILEAASSHIGSIDLKSTAMGRLYLKKGDGSQEPQIEEARREIVRAQEAIERDTNGINNYSNEIKKLTNRIKEISEKIGKTKTQKEREELRKKYIAERETIIKNVDSKMRDYGEYISNTIPHLLIGTAVEKAKLAINLQIGKNNFPNGLNPTLIKYLLDEQHDECICGRKLDHEIREYINRWNEYLPPDSYAQLYNEFSATAKAWSRGFEKERLEEYITDVISNSDLVEDKDLLIKGLDDEAKASSDIQELVEERVKSEDKIAEYNDNVTQLVVKKRKAEAALNKYKKQYNELTKAQKNNSIIERKLKILETVKKSFDDRLASAASLYSRQLQINIQRLINDMLTSKREVTVSKDFAVTVFDSHKSESKSEGQFAVVSFAYIGGILEMLKNEMNLENKEYPLVLDGPFSKLDKEQRANVINEIPKLAPQIILFSKDNLQDLIAKDKLGSVWTIESNEEKNIAKVRRGFLWK